MSDGYRYRRLASVTFDPDVRTEARMRMRRARAQLVNWFAVAGKLRRDTEGLGNLLSSHIPIYRNLMTSCFARK